MTILQIVHHPDERLRSHAQPVDAINAAVRKLAADMLETMLSLNALGLAAPQVGEGLRMFAVAALGKDFAGGTSHMHSEPSHPTVLINPQVELLIDDQVTETEGCLSLPGLMSLVRRPVRVRVTTCDLEKLEPYTFVASGLYARVIQHEYDHLNGVLMIDKASSRWRSSKRRKK